MYVLQRKWHDWDAWEVASKRYPTLVEAQSAYDHLLVKLMYRIAEEYTVVRYKAVRQQC